MELEVREDQDGERLDQFLAGPLGSRALAQRLIEAGDVTVDGAARPKRHRMRSGARVVVADTARVTTERPGGTGEPPPFGVVFEDDHLIVVDKPAGVVVHPARGHRQGTLAQALAGRAAGGEEPHRAGIVHRLDRNTSGLLVVAKSDLVHRRLKAQLAEHRIEREYLALVEGRPPARSGTIDAPIGRDRRARVRISLDSDEPRPARTHFELERALPGATLLRLRLETGRTHQIRVHLQAIGHPVCGDPDYGERGRFDLDRQFLHAARLAFTHPISGAPVDLRSPLPADLQAALDAAAAGKP